MINLIIQSYPEKEKNRLDELNTCLQRNLDNRCIKSIHDLIEPGTTIPKDIKNHSKYTFSKINTTKTKQEEHLKNRLTYKYAFDYINNTFNNGEIVAICNNDIIIDNSDSWNQIKEEFFYDEIKKALFLSRYEIDKDNNIWTTMYSETQDIWILKVPIIDIDLDYLNFSVGCPGCDNKMVEIFYKGEYQIFNWAIKYKIFHYDRVREGKSSLENKEYKLIFNPNTDMSIRELDEKGMFICPYLDYNEYLSEYDPSIVSKKPCKCEKCKNRFI